MSKIHPSLQDAWGMLMIQTQDVTNEGIRWCLTSIQTMQILHIKHKEINILDFAHSPN
jgi:hypothetical protein